MVIYGMQWYGVSYLYCIFTAMCHHQRQFKQKSKTLLSVLTLPFKDFPGMKA